MLGGSTAAALAAAVLAGIAITPTAPLSVPAANGNSYCSISTDAGRLRAPASLAFVLRNDSDAPATLRAIAPQVALNVSEFSFTVSPRTAESEVDSRGVAVGDLDSLTQGRPQVDPSGYTIPAHSDVVVIGTLKLVDGADFGSLQRIGVTFDGPLGVYHSQVFGLSLGQQTSRSAPCPAG